MDFDQQMGEWTTSYSDGDEYDDDPFVTPIPFAEDIDDAPLLTEDPALDPTLDTDSEQLS